jgi:hypothetical protein
MIRTILTHLLIISMIALSAFSANAATGAREHSWSAYWGLGPNFSPIGNLRIGYHAAEFGVINSTGLGAVYVARSTSPIFAELGALMTYRGLGLLAGVGAAWELFSFMDLRMESSVSTDTGAVTGSNASIGIVIGF